MSARGPMTSGAVQAWIEPRAEDPEAISALGVARARLAAGATLQGLRRMRIFELRGVLPDGARLAELLHRSIQFYNPAKERCTLRLAANDPAPIARDEIGVLVLERGGERRTAAERWWRHETGRAAEIREGVVWAARFAGGRQAETAAEDLAILRDRQHGLLSNPHWQEARVVAGAIPLPWIGARAPARSPARSRRPTAKGRDATPRGPRMRRRAAPGATARARERRSRRSGR